VYGVVLVALQEHLREVGGEDLVAYCIPDGATYLQLATYPDEDLLGIARRVADRLIGVSPVLYEVLRSLGEGVPSALRRIAPNLVPKATSFAELVALLEAGGGTARWALPSFTVERGSAGEISLVHGGGPEVCRFDEGLVIGWSAQLGDTVALRHPSCRARGDARCVFVPRTRTPQEQPTRSASGALRLSVLPPPSGDHDDLE
jgi:hypothetical protein